MKKISTIFLQVVVVLIGVVALVVMIRLPLTEGRAVGLDLFSVYADPFIIYGYIASIPFFFALWQAFKLLGYIGQNQVFSQGSIRALRNIKYSALILSGAIVMAGIYISVFHNNDDDPAGFIALCIIATFISVAIATATAVFERNLGFKK